MLLCVIKTSIIKKAKKKPVLHVLLFNPLKWSKIKIIFLYTPWKYQKASGFLIFSGDIERRPCISIISIMVNVNVVSENFKKLVVHFFSTHFMSLVSFCGFLMFSGGIERRPVTWNRLSEYPQNVL